MWRNYLSVALRTLRRQRWYTLVSVLGLGAGIACAVVAYAVYSYAHGFDSFHANADSIYRVIGIHDWNDTDTRFGPVPWDIGSMLAADCPDVKRAVRVNGRFAVLKYQRDVFSEYVTFTDSGFLEMFTFPLVAGRIDLTRRDQIVISEELAARVFGSEDPIGRTVTFTLMDLAPIQMTVTGVIRKPPANTCLRANCLASSSLLADAAKGATYDFTEETWGLFLQVPDAGRVPSVCAQMDKYLAGQTPSSAFKPVKRFVLDPLRTVAERGKETANNSFRRSTPASFVYGVMASALLILILAGFNYINTSIATSARRLKEVGIRKVLGGGRGQLIAQFFCEHAVISVVSMVVGLCLAEFLMMGLNRLFGFIDIHLNLLHRPDMIAFLLLVGTVTALGSGLYPAWAVSAYDPLRVIKERTVGIRLGLISRALLVIQFSLAITVVLASVVFMQNARYNRDIDPGYDMQSVLNVEAPDGKATDVLRNELQGCPGIIGMAGSAGGVGLSTGSINFQYDGRQHEIVSYNVSSGYLEMMKFHLKEGRLFDPRIPDDSVSGLVVNESFVRDLGLASPVNRTIVMNGGSRTIIGVVEDFLTAGTTYRIKPCIFQVNRWIPQNWLHLRADPKSAESVQARVEATCKKLYADGAYNMYWQEETTEGAVQYSGTLLRLNSLLSALAILIGTMGLIALVSSNISLRTKEIGIRKVLGARISQVVVLLNRELILVLGIAVLIADLGGHYLITIFLDSIWYYHTPVGLLALLISDCLIVMVAGLTISWQVWRAATANPVDSLKYE